MTRSFVIVGVRKLLDQGDAEAALDAERAARPNLGSDAELSMLRGYAHEMLAARTFGARRRRRLRDAIAAHQAAAALALRGDETAARQVVFTRLGTTLFEAGLAGEALHAFDAALEAQPKHLEAGLGRAEALFAEGRGEAAFAALEPLLGDRPDGFVIAAQAAHGEGALDDFATFLDEARKRVASGYVGLHRPRRHLSLAAARAAYAGKPLVGDGIMATIGALLARTPAPEGAPVPDADELRDILVPLVPNLVRQSRTDLLDRLLEPRAEAMAPGTRAEVIRILAANGIQLGDDGEPDPVYVATSGPAAAAFVTELLAAHARFEVRPFGDDFAPPRGKRAVFVASSDIPGWGEIARRKPRARLVTVSHGAALPRAISDAIHVERGALLADPKEALAKLFAALGEPFDPRVLRRLVEIYPGRDAHEVQS